ncbi:transcriptional regulator family: Fungal Specific TF [Paecilomyces variotii]|nr:transcriptional regulator family: Fungal Specific TF [Paecilomyces variotii]KAJ9320593.1 transcriptional regulator family: Fungal Specific TF [Paecilomyces variotii]KAJ9328409.1 transcriptional regulator family: Fungal Specific TF [Paecilomyces variotii]KAJ9410645.1 transcriptional regulator family: Fungal Specific TF [Paecilomyces variotii]
MLATKRVDLVKAECRKRKVKCDEKQPECSQCLRSGRVCRIIDGVFRPHYFPSPPLRHSRARHGGSTRTRSQRDTEVSEQETESSGHAPQAVDVIGETTTGTPEHPSPAASFDSPSQHGESLSSKANSHHVSSPNHSEQAGQDLPAQSMSPADQPLFPGLYSNTIDHASPVCQNSPGIYSLPASLVEESDQDRAEIAFFLRIFSEETAHWMDVATGQLSYFSQNSMLLCKYSPLVRYAAAALAAKQLGQMRDPASKIRRSGRQKLIEAALMEATNLGTQSLNFLWYGAKYYAKAIQLLSKQISREDRSNSHLSPGRIYQPNSAHIEYDDYNANEDKNATIIFQSLAACILCQYEDLSATVRAVSGHLDGIFKLLRPHLYLEIGIQIPRCVPQFKKALETSFWFFVLNDMLNAYSCRKKCRVNTDDLSLWRKMGLPLDESGHLIVDYLDEAQNDSVFFRYLIRLMCELVNYEASQGAHWIYLEAAFDRWQTLLPPSFSANISQPLLQTLNDTSCKPSHHTSSEECWFPTDTCAIAMAFYHMARTLLLVKQPRELFLSKCPGNQADLLDSYNSLQHQLHCHSMQIISIARGMPSNTVRKYLIQPLYVTGRCLTDSAERQEVLYLLDQIEADVGIFTEYRKKDLLKEWGVPIILEAARAGELR